MATNYTSEHTGAEIDAAVNKSNNPDTTVTEGSGNLVTSGAVHDALYKPTTEEAAALLKALGINVSAEVLNYLSGLSSNLTELLNKKVDDTDIIDVAHGGTGQKTLTADSFLVGNNTGAVKLLTPTEVLSKIGAARSDHTHNVFSNGLKIDSDGTQSFVQYEDSEGTKWLVGSDNTQSTPYWMWYSKVNNALAAYLYHDGSLHVNGSMHIGDQCYLPHQKNFYTVQDGTNNLSAITCNSGYLIFGQGGYSSKIGTTAIRGNALELRSRGAITFIPYDASTNMDNVILGSVTQSDANMTCLRSATNNSALLGASTWRWSKLWTNAIDTVSAVNVSSDRRVKDNISYDTEDMLGIFDNIKPASFTLNELEDDKRQYGFIAQDIIAACEKIGIDPDELGLVTKTEIDPEVELPEGYGERTRLSVAYSQLSAILWAKMKQQEETIKQLQKTVEKLVETVGGEAVWQ